MEAIISKRSFHRVKQQRRKDILSVADRLRDVRVSKHHSLQINLSDHEGMKAKIKELSLNGRSGIYLFFCGKSDVPSITEALNAYRKKQRGTPYLKKDALPRPNPDAVAKEGCLYVGMSSRGGLKRRLIDHIFDSLSPPTGSLKLSKWAHRLKCSSKVRVEILVFEDSDRDCIRELEKGFWNYYGPAIGER